VKTFPSAKIRNVALVGHGNAGKTTLAEALLFSNGITQRMGRVEDGNTVSDFDPEEHKRGISTNLSILPFEYDGFKINILDCPGYADFVGDVVAALRVADLVLFVISAVEGVEVQAEIVWKMAEAAGVPRAVFINKLDRDRASFSRTTDDLKNRFGAGIAPLQLPIGEEADLSGVVDLLSDKAYTYTDGRSTVGEVRASWSPTTTSWSGTCPTRPSTTRSWPGRWPRASPPARFSRCCAGAPPS
jgi:elongation factor G